MDPPSLPGFALPFVKLGFIILSPFLHFSFFKLVSNSFNALLNKFGWVITGDIGDIAIYTTMDEKSKNYRIRQQILNGSQALVEAVLNDET